jgi:tRNA1(Val) A37 N6-methylase TrmN6
MIKLEEHIVEIDGTEYVPVDIAKAAIAVAYNDNKLDEAMNMIKQSVNEINNSVNQALKDD